MVNIKGERREEEKRGRRCYLKEKQAFGVFDLFGRGEIRERVKCGEIVGRIRIVGNAEEEKGRGKKEREERVGLLFFFFDCLVGGTLCYGRSPLHPLFNTPLLK